MIMGVSDVTSEVSTSRTNYAPGELIEVTATCEGAVEVTFEVMDPDASTILIWTLDVEANGSAYLAFLLPMEASTGRYSVHISYIVGNVTIVETTDFQVEVERLPDPDPIPDPIIDPWFAALLALIGGGGTFYLLWSVETSKYILGLTTIFLFARLKKHDILDNKTRYAINGIILENPGIHYNAIMREFGLTNGVAAYHLRVMEREDFIRSVRDGKLKRFYPARVKIPKNMRLSPEALRDEMLRAITSHPGISQRELVEEMGLTRDTIGYHLRELVKEDVLVASKKGKFTVYHTRRLL